MVGAACAESGSTDSGGSRLVVGSWNMSHWTPAKARTVFEEVGADILALQETHLAALPLEWAHGTARDAGWTLVHGHPIRPTGGRIAGTSCGVGFVLRAGVAAATAVPVGAAWRWLHVSGRVHGVRLAPRVGLPRGLLLLSIYAPLQIRQAQVDRQKFTDALAQVTHELDLQIPTLLLGDFNGSAVPGRDFRSDTALHRAACPLLEHLLGPGGAWVDVHAALLPEPLPWTFQVVHRDGALSASRIDLVLANHAAMALVRGARVLSDVRDGGHSPVLVELALTGPIRIEWRRPRAKLPELLAQTSQELRSSDRWAALLEEWSQSPVTRRVLDRHVEHCASSLSTAMLAALQHLVALAGGWTVRASGHRSAYDSNVIRRLRQQLEELHRLERLLRDVARPGVGCWPREWTQLCASLHRRGVVLPCSTAVALQAAVVAELHRTRGEVDKLNREMRAARHARWRDARPQLWKQRPGVIYHWLQAPTAAWGCTPMVDEAGQQCLSVPAVDRAVRGYWVDQVLCQHRDEDEADRWRLFTASEFFPHIPVLEWPHAPWSGERVAAALQTMREGASPGLPNVPIAVWKSLPAAWLEAVARLLNLIETERAWPVEWLEAYVVMIPKAAGGTRRRDQRPITVLPMVYRLWSKGVVLEWTPVLQQAYLGQAAMGFRAQAGTLHVAQLLSDLIVLCRRRKSELWLMSFDIEKCYDSVPWWALFGIMRQTGIAEAVVQGFEAYYRGLRRRFRYGQVDGEAWQATNSLMQGCPASPDELNLLMEPFHRWALAAGLGVDVGCGRIPSVSFADDVALVAQDRAEAETLIAAYLRWCGLLQLKVTKVQLWSNTGCDHEVLVGEHRMRTAPTFKVVGVVLGEDERLATEVHVAPRMAKAISTLKRLGALDLPASICGLLWRTAVLPQALYGCELRNVTQDQLRELSSESKTALGSKFPLRLNGWRAPEILSGIPLGDSAVQDPEMEMRERQLRWWQVVANSPSLVGTVHRAVAWQSDTWREPTPAMASALRMMGWRAKRNLACLRAAAWPLVTPEQTFPGDILLHPVDDFALPGAVYTDGSVSRAGGAAAVQPDEEVVRTVCVPSPRSSTHCELVALALAMDLEPPHILTDSLAALHLLRSWRTWSVQRVLQTVDRTLVRLVLHLAGQLRTPPRLEKVKAHDEAALAIGHPKAVGNDSADGWAKRAATEPGHAIWSEAGTLHGDPVTLEDLAGSPVVDVRRDFAAAWWTRRHRSTARARVMLERMFPSGVEVAWAASNSIFRRPVVQGAAFVHPIQPRVIKWIARVRTGCLATRMRLVSHRLSMGSTSCPCCGAVNDDDEHVLTGCSATGSLDWVDSVREVWRAVASEVRADLGPPPEAWLLQHCFLLRAAMIPADVVAACGVPEVVAPRFLVLLHRALAELTAESLRRREELRQTAASPSGTSSLVDPEHDVMRALENPSLPVERQLSVQDLRQAERARRAAQQTAATVSQAGTSTPAVPASGEYRRRWLRERLVAVVSDDMVVCPPAGGVGTVAILELFERVTGEAFSDTPGTLVGNRIRGLAKVLGNIARDVPFDPPLAHVRREAGVLWNRKPRIAKDVVAWRRSVEESEAFTAPVPRLTDQVAATNRALARWVLDHPYLVPAPLAASESGMALLILWEVDHNQTFPSMGGDGLSAALTGFTKRLTHIVAQEPRLAWLTSLDVHAPLSRGLAPSHHRRWTVRVKPPAEGEPQGWYLEFVGRWRAYVRALVCPPGSRPMSEVTPELLAQIRPGQRCVFPTVCEAADVATSSSSPVRTDGGPEPGLLAGRPPERLRGADSSDMEMTDLLQSVVRVSPPTAASVLEAGVRADTPLHPAADVCARPLTLRRRGLPPSEASDGLLTADSTEEPSDAVRPPARKRQRPLPPAAQTVSPPPAIAIDAPPAAIPVQTPAHRPRRPREERSQPGPPPQRQRTLLSWVRVLAVEEQVEADHADTQGPRHGRAVEGPPT